jgi:hypothetical protein
MEYISVSLGILVLAMLFGLRYRIPHQCIELYWFSINKLVNIIANKYKMKF